MATVLDLGEDVPFGISPWELLLLALVVLVPGIPAFVIVRRRRAAEPGLAFVPLVGPYIAILRAIGTTAWWSILGLIPYVNFGFQVWLAFVVPGRHGRTRWWALPLIVPGVNLLAYYAYAFTLERLVEPAAASAGSE